MADPTAEIPDWKVADGVYVTMTANMLHAVKVAGFAHIAATHPGDAQWEPTTARYMRGGRIDFANTPESVAQIDKLLRSLNAPVL